MLQASTAEKELTSVNIIGVGINFQQSMSVIKNLGFEKSFPEGKLFLEPLTCLQCDWLGIVLAGGFFEHSLGGTVDTYYRWHLPS